MRRICCRRTTDLNLVQAQVSPSWECCGPGQNHMTLKLMLLARYGMTHPGKLSKAGTWQER